MQSVDCYRRQFKGFTDSMMHRVTEKVVARNLDGYPGHLREAWELFAIYIANLPTPGGFLGDLLFTRPLIHRCDKEGINPYYAFLRSQPGDYELGKTVKESIENSDRVRLQVMAHQLGFTPHNPVYTPSS